MSIFGALMGDFDDDLGIMGSHMNAMNMQMRSMNRLMNSLMPDPFNMLSPFDPGFQQNALMERGQPAGMGSLFPAFPMPMNPNMNRLLGADLGAPNGASFCSSSVITMSSGPDGRPQYYQATSSQKFGPGGVRETRNTEQDSRTGVKKMAIGHHIGERAHIIEKEQDMHSGQLEERQEFINLEEDDAEQFDREFTSRASRGGVSGPRGIRGGHQQQYQQITNGPSTVTIEPVDDSDEETVDDRLRANQRYLPALPAPPPQTSAAPATSQPHNSAANENATTTTTTTAATAAAPRHVTTSQSGNKNAAAIAAAAAAAPSTKQKNDSSYYAQNSMPRRSHMYRSHLASPRRPLRIPSSSPLATTSTPTTSSITTAPSAASHHHHPYNNAAAVRRQQRKQNQKQQQQQHQQQNQQQQQQQQEFHLQGVQVPTEATTSRQSKQGSRRH